MYKGDGTDGFGMTLMLVPYLVLDSNPVITLDSSEPIVSLGESGEERKVEPPKSDPKG